MNSQSDPASRPNLLVAGVGPLPPERPDRLFAPGLRIWGIARELARAGHCVRLVCAPFGQDGLVRRYDLAPERDPGLSEGDNFTLQPGELPRWLARQAADFNARAAIGSTDLINHALARAELDLPIWMDYFGDPMAERQMLALRLGSDDGLAQQWALLVPALARADRLSGCSADQCAALLGQLGAVGRLNRHTVCEALVHCLPPWVELIPIDIDSEPILRGQSVPQDAFLVLQTGGFNTWLDVETLFAGLQSAMAADPRVHFAATGGAIAGHYISGFEWFEAQARQSLFHERFHLLGWLPLGQVPRVILEADLGLNVDLACAEGRLGTRNRLMDWLLGALSVVSTPGCELAEELYEEKCITLIPHGSPEAVAHAIAAAAADPAPGRQAAQAGARYLREAHSPAQCLKPLLDWAAAPQSASDLHSWREEAAGPPSLLLQSCDAQQTLRQARQQAEKLAWLERRLARFEGSRLIRWALTLRGRSDLEADRPPGES